MKNSFDSSQITADINDILHNAYVEACNFEFKFGHACDKFNLL